ncbi:MAG: LPS export ABC transporter permease LptG [Deltaproteobacteria bacterium]|nr:LPS export ABC transporter permease LptG [Candidatus Anaeroferrophillacea bacterium]
MNLIARHIARRFFFWWLLCGLLLVGLFSLFDLAAQIDDLEAGYRLADALLYVALKVPGRFIETAPPAILLAGVATLGIMAEHQELLALQAAGIGTARIAWQIVKPALAVLLLLMLAGQFIAPPMEQRAWVIREQGRSQTGTFLPNTGFWVRRGRQFINLRPDRTGHAAGRAIEIYRFAGDGRLESLIQAPEVSLDNDNEWILHRARTRHFDGGNGGIIRASDPEIRIQPPLTGTETRIFNLPARTLSFSELHALIGRLRERRQYAGTFRTVFWQKLTQAPLALAMLALAFPFTLGRPRQMGLGWRIMVGAVTGVLGYFIHQVFVNLGLLWSWPAPLTAIVPIGVFLLAAPLLRPRRG